MLKANQSALAQQTNQGVVVIRQSELSFYISFFMTFGAQAVMIANFTYQNLTQISIAAEGQYLPYASLSPYWYTLVRDLYWISVAACLGSSMHVILTTTLLQIYVPRFEIAMASEFEHLMFILFQGCRCMGPWVQWQKHAK